MEVTSVSLPEHNTLTRENNNKLVFVIAAILVVEIAIVLSMRHAGNHVGTLLYASIVYTVLALTAIGIIEYRYNKDKRKKYTGVVVVHIVAVYVAIILSIEISCLTKETAFGYYLIIISACAFLNINPRMALMMLVTTYIYYLTKNIDINTSIVKQIPDALNALWLNIVAYLMVKNNYMNNLSIMRQETKLIYEKSATTLVSEIAAMYIIISRYTIETMMNETVSSIGQFTKADYAVISIPNRRMEYQDIYEYGTLEGSSETLPVLSIPIAREGLEAVVITLHGKDVEQYEDLLNSIGVMIVNAIDKVNGEITITKMAYYDQLTGIANRTLYKDRLDKAIEKCVRKSSKSIVMYLDLDGFKKINDTSGHDAGDAVLIEIASRLTSCVRKYDTVCRMGGDEYALIIDEITNIKKVKEIAAKIISVCNEPIQHLGKKHHVSASIGVAIIPDHGNNIEDITKTADQAMYSAKNSGKNKYIIYQPCRDAKKVHSEIVASMVKERNVTILYQPQYLLGSNTLVGAEALLRTPDKYNNTYPIIDIIRAAETSGQMVDLGNIIFETIIKDIYYLKQSHGTIVPIAINISVEQLKTTETAEYLIKLMKYYNIQNNEIEIEITETMGSGSYEKEVLVSLSLLEEYGIKITLDDFGTEYSSLHRIIQMPIKKIKIAKEIVCDIEKLKNREIVNLIINMGKCMGYEVLAEGVETAEQEEVLVEAGCNLGQGYVYSAAITLASLSEKIADIECVELYAV